MATILCPVDFSESSDAAVDLAVAAAYARGARLVLLHVDPPPTRAEELLSADNYKTLRRKHEEWLKSRMATARMRLHGETEVDSITRIARGEPAKHILSAAAELKADLIVMSTHSSRLRRALLGSVAERVAQAAPCPVLLTRTDSYVKVPFEKPLICVDFSSLSDVAVKYALEVSADDAHIELLHVVDEPGIAAMQVSLGQRSEVLSLIDTMHSDAKRKLEKFAINLPISTEGSGPKQTVVGGQPAASILKHADEAKSSLIVVGSHRPEGLRQRVIGTVADRVLHHAEVPVLLCPAG